MTPPFFIVRRGRGPRPTLGAVIAPPRNLHLSFILYKILDKYCFCRIVDGWAQRRREYGEFRMALAPKVRQRVAWGVNPRYPTSSNIQAPKGRQSLSRLWRSDVLGFDSWGLRPRLLSVAASRLLPVRFSDQKCVESIQRDGRFYETNPRNRDKSRQAWTCRRGSKRGKWVKKKQWQGIFGKRTTDRPNPNLAEGRTAGRGYRPTFSASFRNPSLFESHR